MKFSLLSRLILLVVMLSFGLPLGMHCEALPAEDSRVERTNKMSTIGSTNGLTIGSTNVMDQMNDLYKQLCELNKEWKSHAMEEILLGVKSNPQNSTDLIQLHLELVEQTLRSKSTAELSSRQLANRRAGLDYLKAYHECGNFPKNTKHNVLTPYFIDDFNTACAVGHILIESGGEDLADKISRENNYAFIENMNYPELSEWAYEMGFTVEELKWIQPTYAPPLTVFTEMITPNCNETNGGVNVIDVLVTDWAWQDAEVLSSEIIWADVDGNPIPEENVDGLDLVNVPSGIYRRSIHVSVQKIDESTGFMIETVLVNHNFEFLGNQDVQEVTGEIFNETCTGYSDGAIELNLPEDQIYTATWFDWNCEPLGEGLSLNNLNGFNFDGIDIELEYYLTHVEVIGEDGCRSFGSFLVEVDNQLPYFFPTISIESCVDGLYDVFLNMTDPATTTVAWSNGATGQQQTLPVGEYSVTLTNAGGCDYTSNIAVVDQCSDSTPCDDLFWLEEIISENDCCISTILNFDLDGEEVFYAIPGGFEDGACPTDGPVVGYLYACDGSVICESYIFGGGENACSEFLLTYDYENLEELVYWISPCSDCVIPWLPEMVQVDIPSVVEPVCDCYGIVYNNPAEALFIGGSLLWSDGDCEIVDDCVNPDNIDLDFLCPTNYVPVCGCDGVTYQNSCYAEKFGGVASYVLGECYLATSCEDPNLDWLFDLLEEYPIVNQDGSMCYCQVDEYLYEGNFVYRFYSNCNFMDAPDILYNCQGEVICYDNGELLPEDQCPLTFIQELTEGIPIWEQCNDACIDPNLITGEACDAVWEPVCGCNGITYGNECEALNWGGVLSWEPGECGSDCIPFMDVWVPAFTESTEPTIICPDFCDIQMPAEINEINSILGCCSADILILEDEPGCFSYLPTPFMPNDELNLLVCNAESGACNDWTIYISIGEDIGLDVEDDYINTEVDVPVEFNVLDNDLGQITIDDHTFPSNGSLVLSDDGIFIYTPNPGFIGYDYFIYFACTADNSFCEEAEVIIEVGDPAATTTMIANPDILFVDETGEGSVCVLDNDVIADENDITISNDSEFLIGDLSLIDNCYYLVVSDAAESGIYEFVYTICNSDGQCIESIVTVVVDGINAVMATDDYSSTDLNTELVIEPLLNDFTTGDPAIQNEGIGLEITSEPLNGEVIVSYNEECEWTVCPLFIYEPNPNFEGTDQFTYTICSNGICDSATVYIQIGVDCTEFCVWPGDANNDGVANNIDLLTIGMMYGFDGLPRPNASSEWVAQPAFEWNEFDSPDVASGSSDVLLLEGKYADCDGDGQVFDQDIVPILNNYGLTHFRPEEENEIEAGVPTIRLSTNQEQVGPGDWLNFDIILEDAEGGAIDNAYGIAFQFDYYNEFEGIELIPHDSIEVSFGDSWLNGEGVDEKITLVKNLSEIGGGSKIDMAVSRINAVGAQGSGNIGSMSCFITENITGKKEDNITVYFTVTQAYLIYSDGTIEQLNHSSITSDVATTNTGLANVLENDQIAVYPNPAKNVLNIDWNGMDANVQSIGLHNLSGQTLIDNKINGEALTHKMDLVAIPAGLYLLEMKTDQGTFVQKVSVLK